MISHLQATGHLTLPMAMVGDLCDIDARIKNGDESGWRGDPSMGVFLNAGNGQFEVWGVDRGGNEYLAASHDRLDHTLLVKLREGDPTRHDVIQRVLDANAKLEADRQATDRDAFGEVAEKIQWGIRQDFAQHLGGRGGIHAVPGKGD